MDDRVMTGMPQQPQGTEARLGVQRRDQVYAYLSDPRNPVYIKNVTPSVVNIEDRWSDKGVHETLRGFQAANLSDIDRQVLASSEAFKKALYYGQVILIDEDQYLQELEKYRAAQQQQALVHQQRMQLGLVDVGGRQVEAQVLDTGGSAAPPAPDPRQMLRDPLAYAQAVQNAMAQGVSPEQFSQMVENQRVPIGLGAQIGQPQVVSGGMMPGMQSEASAGPKPISAIGNVASVPHGAYDPIRMTRTGGATVAAPIGQGEGAVPNYPTVPMGNFNMQGTVPGYGGFVAPQAAPTMPTIPQAPDDQPQMAADPTPMYPQQTHAGMGFQQQVPQAAPQPMAPLVYTNVPQPPQQPLVYPGQQQQPQPMPQGPLASGQVEAMRAQQVQATEGVPMEVSGSEGDDVVSTMMQAGIPAN